MSEIRDRISSVATLRPLWAGRTEAVFGRLRINSFGRARLSATFTRIRDTASLLGPAGRGAARLMMERALATPRRVYIGAGAAALVVGIGANALLLQHGRHPAPLLAAHDPSPVSASAAPPAGAGEPSAASSTAPAAQPPAAGESPTTQASAPDTTASIAPQAQDKQHQSSAPAPDSGRRVAALAPDQIGALLRGKTVDDGSHLVREAQIALIKLGYAVKPNGAEDGATRRALRRFERAHGLAPTTEINSELVKQLTAAARPGG
jgi:Putative peptidoglycan binding domain